MLDVAVARLAPRAGVEVHTRPAARADPGERCRDRLGRDHRRFERCEPTRVRAMPAMPAAQSFREPVAVAAGNETDTHDFHQSGSFLPPRPRLMISTAAAATQ